MGNTTGTSRRQDDPAVRARVLGAQAGQSVDHGPYRPVSALFEAQADRTPDRPALSYRGTTVSYRELDELANGLALRLRAAGVQRGDLLPVFVPNSLELPLCMLALMKLGVAFAPCDPAWPAERIQAVHSLLRPRITLVTGNSGLPGLVVDRDHVTPVPERPGQPPGPNEPAYGIFTSGTTGTPKCAVNVHRGLTNRFRFMTRHMRADGSEVVLQNSKHTFDSAIWQLLWPLTTGGHSVIPEQGEFLDLERTVATIAEHRVTITDFVPATLASLVALLDNDPAAVPAVSSLRHLVVGGEEIVPHSVHRLRELVPGVAVSNGYGPSETSIGMVFHPVDTADGDHIPLGRPIDNCYAVVLTDDLGLLPPGEVGEIVIGGACLGTGYFADAGQTARAFVPNPFPEIPGNRLYRTGDLGWFDDRGDLRFAGRLDQQVKIDGVRIELLELEAVAEGADGVQQAKALAVRVGGRNRLAVVAAGTVEAGELRDHLVSRLPRTSMPQHCLVVPALPLTDNGKADLRALEALVLRELAAPRAPATVTGPLPVRIADVLRETLGLSAYGVDDAFLDRGGDSLSGLTAVFRMRELLGVRVGVQDLYTCQTPSRLAALLTGTGAGTDGDHRPGADVAALMESDAALADGLPVLAAGWTPGPQPATVLLTGATGFVGSRILHRLLTATGARVVCLVRAADDRDARQRVRHALDVLRLPVDEGAGRLDARAGDLGAERFGLGTADWEKLAADCDAVVHAGALVNFLLDYGEHRAANVLGTAEVLRFSLAGRIKPLHHVSTLGVLDRHAAATGERLAEDTDPHRILPPLSGYSRSKWVAERLLTGAREQGAPVTVHRLGEVMPAADNGVPNDKALTHLLLGVFHRLGVCPDVPMRSDYTPVDEVAVRIVTALEHHVQGVFNVFHRQSTDFRDVLVRGGVALTPVPEGDFLDRLRADALARPGRSGALLGLLQRAPLRDLLSDNPALFARKGLDAFDRRHGFTDGPLDAAITAYVRTLEAC
ncbi:non-ribosomal peptide synthetase [Streptomyces meridianus]|uniref:Amino acid adenylation domain-containing protein n=1 Tax=Streptomyces meridianus TaxID=2938945 RepID=A0ABT0X2J2_9ACTN|nr:non-ribosomal peptide synthetase [Streptomyces meridianus]MCM2576540.1 amino acid adenylation domain-containing protein [Streptomyces meridianus]